MASNYYAAAVGTTAVRVASFQGVVLVCNNGTASIYLGWDANVTTVTGFPVAANGQVSIAASGVQTLYAISTATQDVRLMIGYL